MLKNTMRKITMAVAGLGSAATAMFVAVAAKAGTYDGVTNEVTTLINDTGTFFIAKTVLVITLAAGLFGLTLLWRRGKGAAARNSHVG